MIRVKVKVKNDQCSLTEDFEFESINLDREDSHFKSVIEEVIKKFNQPVYEVVLKATMDC